MLSMSRAIPLLLFRFSNGVFWGKICFGLLFQEYIFSSLSSLHATFPPVAAICNSRNVSLSHSTAFTLCSLPSVVPG